MKFNLYMYLDNAVFDDNPSAELAKYLREVADAIQDADIPLMYQNIKDTNGNIIGRYAAKHEGE